MRTDSGKPSAGITSADFSQPPLGVNDAMLPFASIDVDVHGAAAPVLRREDLVLRQQRARCAARRPGAAPCWLFLQVDQLRALVSNNSPKAGSRRAPADGRRSTARGRRRRASSPRPAGGSSRRCAAPSPCRSWLRHQRDGLQLGRPLRPEAALEQLEVAEAQRHRLLDARLERFQVARARAGRRAPSSTSRSPLATSPR